jgi:hypothetical protein
MRARRAARRASAGSSVDEFNVLESSVTDMYVRAYMIGARRLADWLPPPFCSPAGLPAGLLLVSPGSPP